LDAPEYEIVSVVSERIGKSIWPSLYDVSSTVLSDINRRFRTAGHVISVDQFTILSGIYLGHGESQKKLAEWLHRDRSVISRLLRILENNGWIVRYLDEKDHRRKCIELTPKTHDNWPVLENIILKTIQARCHDIDPEKLQSCIDVLIQIFINCRPDQLSYNKVST
jgi:DNA-binding MarR family transcriptional regulator